MYKECKKCGVETSRNTRGDCKVCARKYQEALRSGAASKPDKPPTTAQRISDWLHHNYTAHDAPIDKYAKARAREYVKKHPWKAPGTPAPDAPFDDLV